MKKIRIISIVICLFAIVYSVLSYAEIEETEKISFENNIVWGAFKKPLYVYPNEGFFSMELKITRETYLYLGRTGEKTFNVKRTWELRDVDGRWKPFVNILNFYFIENDLFPISVSVFSGCTRKDYAY